MLTITPDGPSCMSVAKPCFVDTNIFVYARDASEPGKQPVAMQWLQRLWERELGRTSMQVLSEYYVTVTAKLHPGLPVNLARSDVRALAVWQPLELSIEVVEGAWDIRDRYGYEWWDSLVIASALFLDCGWLLSEDMQHEQRIGPLTILNPFQVDCDSFFSP